MPTAADERRSNNILAVQRRNNYQQCVQYNNQKIWQLNVYQDLAKDVQDYEEDVIELESQISFYEWEVFLRPHRPATLPDRYYYIESARADLRRKNRLIKDKTSQYQYAVKLHQNAGNQLRRAAKCNKKLTGAIKTGLNKYWVRALTGILPQTLPLIEEYILSFLQ